MNEEDVIAQIDKGLQEFVESDYGELHAFLATIRSFSDISEKTNSKKFKENINKMKEAHIEKIIKLSICFVILTKTQKATFNKKFNELMEAINKTGKKDKIKEKVYHTKTGKLLKRIK